ncbi:hypothetical protein G7Y79_00021g049890 [Physcia stellaris]|nr:hypothetical protein G7Y79_00021g049890 [Physcia stellaris]
MPPAKLHAFLQCWLFFGLLHEVLGDLYRHHDFVSTVLKGEEERTIVSTANLLSRLEVWESQVIRDRKSTMALIAYPESNEELKFHLASVAELIGYAVNKACDVAWTDSPSRSLLPRTWYRIPSVSFKKSVLLEWSNCCPSQVQMLLEDFGSPQALSFVASCYQEDHAHASCSENRCRAGDSDSGRLPRHVKESCDCESLRIDEDLLVDCLRSGRLPLLRLEQDLNLDKMSIEVVPSSDSTSYVALSHVWADGLGNPTETALPRCQLARVKTFINNLDFGYVDSSTLPNYPEHASKLLLWCDSLCCPVISPEGKNMALRQMYRTYDKATIVLVLDQDLIAPRGGRKSVDEACIRTATSRWMTRLWTLQEGALPARENKLWFQFAKTALPAWSLYDHMAKIQETDISRRGVMHGASNRFHTFTSLFDRSTWMNESSHFPNVMRGLMYRSVTVPSDEPLIIATLLGLDLSPILASATPKRMSALWRMLGTSQHGINKFILFHMGAKIHERGFRWALQSILPTDNHYFIPLPTGEDDRGSLATDCNAKGLVVGYKGYWYYLKHRLHNEPDCPPALEEMHATISRLSEPWILYGGSDSHFPDNKGYHGLLVEIATDQELQSKGTTCAEIKSQVSFCTIPPELTQICEAAYCLAQELAVSDASRRCEDLAVGPLSPDNPVHREAFKDLDLEVQRLSRSPLAIEALAATGNPIDEQEIARLAEYIERVYRGMYLYIEEFAPGNEKWCVD